MSIVCPICSDSVKQADIIYVLKCGHVFHYRCLVQWMQRSRTCPQCRNNVTEECMFRLYPTLSNQTIVVDAATLQTRLDDLLLELQMTNALCKEKDDKLKDLTAVLKKKEELLKSYEKKLVRETSAVTALKEQIGYLQLSLNDTNKLRNENEELKENLLLLNGLQVVLNATSEDVENMIKVNNDVKTMAVFVTALKRALCESEVKKSELRDKFHTLKRENALEKNNNTELKTKLTLVEEKMSKYKLKCQALSKRKASEMANQSKENIAKHSRCDLDHSVDLNTAVIVSADNSLNNMVERIENADSPYLNLKQSSVALSAMNRAHSIPTDRIKPSEFALINAARAHVEKRNLDIPQSIFHKKELVKAGPSKTVSPDLSYDGLGGHSKLDTFPKPNARPSKSLIPRLSAKHKLKRPSTLENQNILKFIKGSQSHGDNANDRALSNISQEPCCSKSLM